MTEPEFRGETKSSEGNAWCGGGERRRRRRATTSRLSYVRAFPPEIRANDFSHSVSSDTSVSPPSGESRWLGARGEKNGAFGLVSFQSTKNRNVDHRISSCVAPSSKKFGRKYLLIRRRRNYDSENYSPVETQGGHVFDIDSLPPMPLSESFQSQVPRYAEGVARLCIHVIQSYIIKIRREYQTRFLSLHG